MSLLALNEEQKNWISKYGIDEVTYLTLQQSIFPGAKPESIIMAVQYCKARKLDVLQKPVHIVPMPINKWDEKQNKNVTVWRDVIMPGIYEQRITASRSGGYAGQDAPVFGDIVTLDIGGDQVKAPEHCTVTVYRIIEGQRVPFSHTEWFEEACATKKGGKLNSMWTKRKRGQLAKCAEAGALRKAFPEELGGVMTAEEMQVDEGSQSPTIVNEVKQIELMDSDQVIDLQELIDKAGTSESTVCGIYGVSNLSELPSEKFDDVASALEKKIEQNTTKEAQ